MSKHIVILGSTGSIGTQALSIVEKTEDIIVDAITCGSNIELMEAQVRRFSPRLAVVMDEDKASDLKVRIADTDTRVDFGMVGMTKAATFPGSEMVITAVVGMIGIEPTIAAINAKKDIGLANKETLVCAGDIIMSLAGNNNVKIIPVDSEHSAVFQSLEGSSGNRIKNILLTASGGPFYGRSIDQLKSVTVEDALSHPNWSMGAKITVDSASLMNKGLEVIEACHLFGVGLDRVKVLIHRQSILHSAVEYEDGAIIGQLGVPDMKVPIAYAMFYPKRRAINENPLSLTDIGTLTFEEPDMETFRGLGLCMEAFKRGGNMPAIMNAANEIAVAEFLAGRISFLQIYDIVEKAMEDMPFIKDPSLEQILGVKNEVRRLLTP